MFAQTNFA